MGMARSRSLETLRDNSAFLLGKALGLIARQAPEEFSGYAYFDAAWRYRRLAICELLLEGRQDRFFVLLCKSAQLQRHLQHLTLERAGIEPIHLCASMTQVPVNALVTGCLELAEATARGMPDAPLAGAEYEDDFLFYRFLGMSLLQGRGAADITLQPLMSRWMKVLAGGEDPYLDVCRALAERDEPGFARTFDTLVERRVEQCAQTRSASGPDDEQYQAEGFIFMKGVALLRLADLLGLKTRPEYPLIPRFARLPLSEVPLPASSWQVPGKDLPE